MAQVINTINTNGLFESVTMSFDTLTSDSFSADLKGEKDGVIAVIDIPASVSGQFELVCLSAKGGNPVTVPLLGKVANLLRFTTHGLKKNDGFADFKIVSPSGANVSGAGIKVCFIKYSPVINH